MASTEVIITIGIIISAALILFQLITIFNIQSKLTQKSVVSTFSKELEGRIDKAAAAVEDVNFTYVPPLKSYSLKIENNQVSIRDKVSDSETSFFKLSPPIVNNSFEDAKVIYIIKTKDKILVFADYQSTQFLS